ncbi:MAG: hypothetical protein OXU42_16180 [Deltaproteobacteria bacterium]|nr:hypothetical protein [Deltaproteobacteria bacterium]
MAAMVGAGWYAAARNGGAPGGDMVGHAAAAEWLRTLPWWDWRGWSDWFYGGQAIGVNYPPLGHAWMRFTDPVHGQMAAVAIGLLVLVPWGALRLARAVGYSPRAQRAAVAVVLVLTAASAHMHWFLSGFHLRPTFFGSWPAMVAVAVGLHAAAWAARPQRPATCGALAGVALLFNATVLPGVAAACVVLLATSGASFRQALRWAATAAAAASAVSAWWLVPFLHGRERLVRWEVPLSEAWDYSSDWGVAVLAVLAVGAAWAARRGDSSARRLAGAALAGLLAAAAADLFGYLRPERWLEFPILLAALGTAGLFSDGPDEETRPVRPAWAALGAGSLVVFVLVTLRLEALPLGLWLMWRPRRVVAWGAALAWAAVLVWVPLWALIRNPVPPAGPADALLAADASYGAPGSEGLVYLDQLYNSSSGDVAICGWRNPWHTTARTSGDMRPLSGLYKETSATAEFVDAAAELRRGGYRAAGGLRPHWFEAWDAAGSPELSAMAAAEALGARRLVVCNADGAAKITELPDISASGVAVTPHLDDDSWHRAAVDWWIEIGAPGDGQRSETGPQASAVPVRWSGQARGHPPDESARGVALHATGDRLAISADRAGWVWVRIPWDPYWTSGGGTPVLKGGPGHIVAWADRGTTELRWLVPGYVDAAVAAVTGAALLTTAVLAVVNRRRGWDAEPGRARPAANARDVFASTLDGWISSGTCRARSALHGSRRPCGSENLRSVSPIATLGRRVALRWRQARRFSCLFRWP